MNAMDAHLAFILFFNNKRWVHTPGNQRPVKLGEGFFLQKLSPDTASRDASGLLRAMRLPGVESLQ